MGIVCTILIKIILYINTFIHQNTHTPEITIGQDVTAHLHICVCILPFMENLNGCKGH